jgi:hypothetical protein
MSELQSYAEIFKYIDQSDNNSWRVIGFAIPNDLVGLSVIGRLNILTLM